MNAGFDHHDEAGRIAAERQIDDEDSQRDAHLRGRQADPRCGVHRLDHVVDEALDVGA